MATDRGPVLLAIARRAIAEELGLSGPPVDSPTWLQKPGATFVTLTLDGALRGCIGTLRAARPLGEDVACNARAAAFQDARFEPLTRGEFHQTDLEVSLLSPLEPLPIEGEADLLRRLRPGVDGLVLDYGRWRGAFLPQVWERQSDPKDFLAQLKRKAGLPMDLWDDAFQFSRFTVTRFQESDPWDTEGSLRG